MPSRKAAVVLDQVRQAARGCTHCPLYKLGTQTVFGEGPAPAPVLMVGEQPGDNEDLEGRPFVGPAGQLLDRALNDAGLDRRSIYVTNAVKHFKWQPRGKRRLHKKPIEREIAACRPWLLQELELVQPALIVCLGATAAQSLLGRSFRITQQRGVVMRHEHYGNVMATFHPSALLRMPGHDARERAYGEFVADLKLLRKYFKARAPAVRAVKTNRAGEQRIHGV
ncbi:MAG: UdgX family uracil-DNA binding protein [Steroidobacteraceae bacterium]